MRHARRLRRRRRTKSQILKIMRDTAQRAPRHDGRLHLGVAKAAAPRPSAAMRAAARARLGLGAGPCLVVAQCLSARVVDGAAHAYEATRRRRGRPHSASASNNLTASRAAGSWRRARRTPSPPSVVATAARSPRREHRQCAPRAPRDGGGHVHRRRVRPQRERRRAPVDRARRDDLLPADGAARLPRHRRRGSLRRHRRASSAAIVSAVADLRARGGGRRRSAGGLARRRACSRLLPPSESFKRAQHAVRPLGLLPRPSTASALAQRRSAAPRVQSARLRPRNTGRTV